MYGNNGAILGAGTTAAGVLALPNTGGDASLTALSFALIGIGAVVLLSMAVRFLAIKHLARNK